MVTVDIACDLMDIDETGYVQPTLAELRQVRGLGTAYHFNNIRAWRVRRDGTVLFGLEE